MWQALYVLYLVVGVVLVVVLVCVALVSKRRLDRRVEQFKAEQAENQGPPPDPWMALADLYAEDEQKSQKARAKRKRSA